MADPYRQQYVPPSPRPAPRAKNRPGVGKVVAGLILAAASLALVVVSVMALVNHKPSSPDSGPRPPAASPAARLRPSEARPGVDAGAGTPGAPCSTNRLGMWFIKDGVTYTCKGPAPYRWLA